jgi:hypothetical protein
MEFYQSKGWEPKVEESKKVNDEAKTTEIETEATEIVKITDPTEENAEA